MMIAIFIYTLFKPDLGKVHVEKHSPRKLMWIGAIAAFVIGFYDGLIGPGTGSFFVVAFIALLGFDFLNAYSLKAKTYQLNGDYLVDENLISNEMLCLCEKLNVKCIRIPVDINLHRGVRPQKKYFLFY